MMKRFIKILMVCLAAAVVSVSCGPSREERALAAADEFLTAYYSMDFASAAALCTPSCAALIEQSVSDMASLPEYVLGKMKEASSETSYEIVSVDAESVDGLAVIYYRVSAPGLFKPLEKTLRLKIEGRTALVDAVE